MLSRKPRLRSRRPSPTTVEYTLSTKPPPSLPTALLHIVVLALRLALLSCAILLPASRLAPYLSLPPTFQSLLDDARLGHLSARLSAPLSTPALAAVALLLAFVSLQPLHVTESVLVLRGLGIQTRSSAGLWGLGDATRFIPTEKIRDVLVNEVFVGFGVQYVLVAVVEGEEDMVVVFPRLRGGKDVVLRVWRGVRACLFEGGDGI
ncbi:uncharacterized protein DNG_01575 [Cephalotrichum gorgonifer]|uniref:Phosphatidylinositol N-acetylglucosaminyltransferase subunit H conserved domain-containing protein n=1 Tax=Cephalotrichum gorgonifer TaxID=2041049 RepID=A0AAE8MRY3_9PEZI|nr:uncharacterized protein DNG_01575 [Cephalotrichum gorgonifer]